MVLPGECTSFSGKIGFLSFFFNMFVVRKITNNILLNNIFRSTMLM